MNIAKIKSNFKDVAADPFCLWPFRLTLVSYAACFFLLVVKWGQLPPEVPLFYSLPWGEDQLTPPLTLILVISISLLIYILTVVFGTQIYRRFPYYAHLLFVSATIISLLIVATIVQIVFLIS